MSHHPLDPRTLVRAPELATLAALENILFVATRALVAEHESLCDGDCRQRGTEPLTLREARRLLFRIHPLRSAIARYQRAVLAALEPPQPVADDEDILF
jgi:hypothetical protein